MRIISLLLLASFLFVTACDFKDAVPEDTAKDDMLVTDDEDFLAMMIPHHEEAIKSSETIVAKSSNTELKEFAQKVIDAQTTEVESMKGWATTWFQGVDTEDYESMMPELSMLSGDELDQAYIEGMIDHHQEAVDFAQDIKKYSNRKEILELADSIISTQSAEIDTLESMKN